MNIAWDDVQLFLSVAEAGSVSAGARRLQLGQPTVSRRLADLEYRLGYSLFRRAATGVALTAQGEKLLPSARKMAEWAAEIGRAASAGDKRLEGIVRIAAAPGVSFDFVAPFAAWLRGKQPGLRLESLGGIQYLDLARGEADLAIRARPSNSADLQTLVSLELPVAAFASRAYAAKLPKKYSVRDLDWLAWAPPYENVPPNPQLEQMIPGFKPAFTSDNYLVLLRAAEAGAGAMILGKVKHRFSAPTQLVPLDLDLGPYGTSSIHLVCAKSALDIPRVRYVAQLLTDELSRLER